MAALTLGSCIDRDSATAVGVICGFAGCACRSAVDKGIFVSLSLLSKVQQQRLKLEEGKHLDLQDVVDIKPAAGTPCWIVCRETEGRVYQGGQGHPSAVGSVVVAGCLGKEHGALARNWSIL